MIGWTLCSGIGAPEVAAPWVDWRLASEIEPFPRAVLQERFGYRLPEDHNQGEPLLWGDMTEVTPELARAHGVPLPDLLVAGTPCQAFSIAGLRGGVSDARGNLTLKFVETCHAIVDARPDGKLAVLWENVPGVLSDKGNAFGCFLGGLVGAVDALQPPTDGAWPSEGMVQGPRARLSWCVLDAQWFGVAQRRRRVFVVVDFGGSCDPAKVLLEPDRLRGDTPPRRETGQDFAGVAGKGADDGQRVSHTLTAGMHKSASRMPHEQGALVPVHAARMVAFGEYSEDGSADALKARDYKDATDLVYPVAFDLRGRDDGAQVESVGQTVSLRAADGGSSRSYVAFTQNTRDEVRLINGDGAIVGALAAETGAKQQSYIAGKSVASVFDPNQITSKTNRSIPSEGLCHTIPNTSAPPVLFQPSVRLLMPVECERLQGFPDQHTNVTYRNKPASDGPRYKALGNSMAVPCIAWILERMET
jgi:DNA (cytosine-5)-methyltransferase 1